MQVNEEYSFSIELSRNEKQVINFFLKNLTTSDIESIVGITRESREFEAFDKVLIGLRDATR